MWAALATLLVAAPARAQLATLFYSVTGIETRQLPNAVQVTIRTDGAVQFGGDLGQIVDLENGFQPRTVTSLRLRLLRARARLPSFVNIGAYPVDAAAVSLGTDTLQSPFFNGDTGRPSDPRVDIELRFFVPVTIQRFLVDGQYYGPSFRDVLRPLDVGVTLGPDRSSIVITVITDRLDRGASRIRRSPAGEQKHRLAVTPNARTGRLRLSALHAPLDSVAQALSAASALPLTVDGAAAETDVSLLLPDAAPLEALGALAAGYDLVLTPRPPADGGGFALARGGAALTSERLPLNNLTPSDARLLFPDFLLPFLRADVENNALIVSGSPALIARVRRDLGLLDRPRPQVRIDVSAWEVASGRDAQETLHATRTLGRDSKQTDTDAGDVSLQIGPDQKRQFTATLTALSSRGRAHLVASPFVVVASGAAGTVFLGQNRSVQVLRQSQGRQNAQIIQIPIGSSLTVLPTVGPGGDITLDLTPRFSTVDAIERGTGLPTVGTREIDSHVRLGAGESLLLASLDTEGDADETRRPAPLARVPLLRALFGARRRSRSHTALIVLVTARKLL